MKFQSVGRDIATEHNDCVVRAFANVTGMPYEHAHRLASEKGRRFGHRTPWNVVSALFDPLGPKTNVRMTIAEFVRTHQIGTFAVHIRGHIFAIRNGVCLDMSMPRERQVVQTYWHITGALSVVSEKVHEIEFPVIRTQQRAPLSPNAMVERLRALTAQRAVAAT